MTKLRKGTLVIRVQPSWANIFVDGALVKEQARTYRGELEPGPHTILLENPYYQSVTEVVDVTSDNTTERSFVLKTTGNQR